MLKGVKNIGLIFVLISTTVLTGRFFLENKNNYSLNSERDDKEIRKKYFNKFKPFIDKAKKAKDEGDYEMVVEILKDLNFEIDNLLFGSSLQKNRFKSQNFNAIGQNYEKLGSFQNAEAYYLKSAKINLKLPFKKNYQSILDNYFNLANLYKSIGDYDRAIATLKISKDLIKQETGEEKFGTYLANGEIARILLLQGKLLEAEYYLEVAIKGIKETNKDEFLLDSYEYSLALVYLQQNRYKQSEYILRKLINKKYKVNYEIFAALSRALLLQGKYDEAEKISLELLNKYQDKYGSDNSEEIIYLLANIAAVYDYQKLYSKAQPYYLRLLNLDINSSQIGIYSSIKILNNIAFNYLNTGFYDAAENIFINILDINKAIYKENNNQDINPSTGLALLFAIQKKYEKSNYYARKALTQIFETIQKQVQGLNIEERYNFVSENYSNFHLFPFSWIEKDKSFENVALFSRLNYQGLLQEIESKQSKLKIQENNKELISQLRLLESQLSSSKTLNYPKYRKELYSKKNALEKILNLNSPKLKPKIYDIDEIAKVIPEQSVLIEFQKYNSSFNKPHNNLEPNQKYIAFILEPEGNISSINLGSAEIIESKIEEALNATYSKNNVSMKLWQDLSDLLIRPLKDKISGNKRLIISPDSVLNNIPFATLGSPFSKNLLIDDFKLNLITTGRDLLNISDSNYQNTGRAIVIANPNFGKPKSDKLRIKNIKSDFFKRTETEILQYDLKLKGTVSKSWKPLPFSKVEGEDIKKIINAELFMDKEAKASLILEQNISPKIIHIASHSFYIKENYDNYSLTESKNPLNRSGIVLAGANLNFENDKDDGFLTALEISRLDLRGTELFVISGCESAKGDLRIGEGVYGLKRSIEVAGADSSLLSLWNVRDDSTAMFMTSFYERLKKGESKSDALYNTQKDFRYGKIKSKNPELYDWSKPYYWAPFQLSGNWKAIEI